MRFKMETIDFSKYKVLAVDDVPLNLLLVETMLAKFKFNISKAGNGRIALEMIAADKPDLILLDLLMPEVDGFEVLRRVRENPETADIRIIILSALNSNEDIVRGFQLGANDFITKPIIMEKLVSCVATQLRLVER